MAKTAAERQAAYRRRKNNQGYAEKERMRMQRKRRRMSPDTAETQRRLDAARKRKSRSKHRETGEGAEQLLGPSVRVYNTVQTLGKAVRRAKRSLPTCPLRRTEVLHQLAKECGLRLIDPRSNKNAVSDTARIVHRIDPDTQKAIVDFYHSEEISWQSPNRKDQVIVRRKGDDGRVQKTYLTKRYLLMSIKEAYACFQRVNADAQVGFSKFHMLKPVQIDTFANVPHEVCLCVYHENIRLLMLALNSFVGIPINFQEMLDNMVCDQTKEKCMMRECELCLPMVRGFEPRNFFDNPSITPVKFEQWERENGRVTKVAKVLNLVECFRTFTQQLDPFCRHVFIKRCQAKSFVDAKKAADGKHVVLQVDFAENASLIHQNEVQSAHWSHPQVALFTVHMWIDQETEQGYVITSDHLERDKKMAVYKFLDYLFSDLQIHCDGVEFVTIFSDGAASQFKQKFLMSLLHVFQHRYGILIVWEFFASSHGKGVVDGHGGDVKSAVWRRVRCGAQVLSAEDFTKVASEACPRLKIVFIPKGDIEANRADLQDHWAALKNFKGIQKSHCIRVGHDTQLILQDFVNGPQTTVAIY